MDTKGTELPRETLAAFQNDGLRARIFYDKYALRNGDNEVGETTPEEMWKRVARGLASVEVEERRKEWERNFFWLLGDFRFVPGGRILHAIGNPNKVTSLNCFRAGTPVHVENGIFTIESLEGRHKVLSEGGAYREALFTCFGKQPLIAVTLENGDVLFATPGHEWITTHNNYQVTTVPTTRLKGRKIPLNMRPRPEKNREFAEGVRHGIVYGDGSRLYKNSKPPEYSGVRLFGPKMELARWFGESPKSELSYKDQTFVEVRGLPLAYKLPPENASPSYLYGFVCGLIATDGFCTEKHNTGIDQSDNDFLNFLRDEALPKIGMYGSPVKQIRERSPFDNSIKPCFRLLLFQNTLTSGDILRPDHKRHFDENKGKNRISWIKVTDVQETSLEEEVYCCVEPETHTMTIGRGYLTRQCYVVPSPDDSIPGIYQTATELAETFKRGGGCGVDISSLRPKNSPAHNAARVSTGAVSFMELYSLTTGIIGQSGRRGALMLTISDSHPDVLDFCKVKRNRTSVRYANISVRVTDAFMQAVVRDGEWLLHYENSKERIEVKTTIRARELWDELIIGATEFAEPGCLFWSTIQRYSSSDRYPGMEVVSTNPCGEEPLESYGDCCLGSINLPAFVTEPFTPNATVDLTSLEMATRYSVRFLDNVLTWNEGRHPLKEQEEAALRGRRIGLGIMGLADMLCQVRLKYDSDGGILYVDQLLKKIKLWAYDESAKLAGEKGPFPVFDARKHLENPFFKDFPPGLVEKIAKNGLRNVTLLTIPPTGSIAAMAGVTSGIEPIFDLKYVRRSESLSENTFEVEHPLTAKYRQSNGGTERDLLPAYFVTAHTINPEKRVLMQAACQRHIDQAISSTINLPKDSSSETVERIYRLAWEQSLKGITVYREGSREGILITEKEAKNSHVEVLPSAMTPRPVTLCGMTTRERTPLGTAFITINYANANPKDPFEVFVRLGKAGSDLEADAEAIGRLLSVILRLPSPMTREERLREVTQQLEHIGGSRSTGFGSERVRSMPDGIARALSRYLETAQNGGNEPPIIEISTSARGQNHDSLPAPATAEDFCPNCQQASLITRQGCLRCAECGYKEC